MKVLVLGGTHHVGRSIVETALARGDEVSMLNRGLTGRQTPGATLLRADRLVPDEVRAALGDTEWDAVLDTWSGAPSVVRESARLLAGRTRHYSYVSSRSVYVWPIRPGLDESAPVVDGDPSAEESLDYAAAKRGSELAVLESFSSTLIARAGLILGPYEDVGRLPWWLRRIERGGRVLAPGPRDRPLQYIDARDLAAWMLAGAQRRLSGTFNAVGPPGATTMGRLLDAVRTATGSDAQLVWVSPEAVETAGIAPWTEMPIWVPPTGDFAGLHNGNVKAALREGLRCRPIEETVADTWAWLQAEGDPPPRDDRLRYGLSPAREAAALAAAGEPPD